MFLYYTLKVADKFKHNSYFKKLLLCSDFSKDSNDYALKQIEGAGISMSACREVAVSVF